MKKALSAVFIGATSLSLAFAQFNINITNTAQQGQINTSSIEALLSLANNIVVRLVPIAIGLAVLAFFWFLIEFIWKGREDGDAKKRSLAGMGYSILAIFVMVSIWGIISFLGNIVGIGQGGGASVPGVPVYTPPVQ